MEKQLFSTEQLSAFLKREKARISAELKKYTDADLLSPDFITTFKKVKSDAKIKPLIVSTPVRTGLIPMKANLTSVHPNSAQYEVAIYQSTMTGDYTELLYKTPKKSIPASVSVDIDGNKLRWEIGSGQKMLTGNTELQNQVKDILITRFKYLKLYVEAINSEVEEYNLELNTLMDEELVKMVDTAKLRKEAKDNLDVSDKDFE